MQVYSNHYNRRQSGSHSRKAEKQKKRFEKRREKRGIKGETKSRKQFWTGYFSLIQKASENLENDYNTNGGFANRLEVQQKHFKRLPFRFVVRYLSDDAFSYMKRLPLSNGTKISVKQPNGYRYAGTIPASEERKMLESLFPEEIEEIKTVEVQTNSEYIPRINIYVRKEIPKLKITVQEIATKINEDYGWFGKKLEDIVPVIGEREKAVLLDELKPTLSKEQRKILYKVIQPRIENIVY